MEAQNVAHSISVVHFCLFLHVQTKVRLFWGRNIRHCSVGWGGSSCTFESVSQRNHCYGKSLELGLRGTLILD